MRKNHMSKTIKKHLKLTLWGLLLLVGCEKAAPASRHSQNRGGGKNRGSVAILFPGPAPLLDNAYEAELARPRSRLTFRNFGVVHAMIGSRENPESARTRILASEKRARVAMASCKQMADNGRDYFHPGHSTIVDSTGELVGLIPGSFIFEHLRPRVVVGEIHPKLPQKFHPPEAAA